MRCFFFIFSIIWIKGEREGKRENGGRGGRGERGGKVEERKEGRGGMREEGGENRFRLGTVYYIE